MSLRVGIVGCGNISDIYFANLARLGPTRVTACADLRPEAAAAQGAKWNVPAVGVAELMARDDVDLVLNLTIPAAHAEVSLAAIAAGKHVHSEKPLATSLADGRAILAAAAAKGVRVGAAPDTVLGPGLQRARAVLDGGLGAVIAGTAAILSHGMEHWHPNPGFFFQPGAGPVLDMGPYYLTALVHLLGPVARIRASGRIGAAERLVTAEGPMKGRTVPVATPTTINGLLSFASGAEIVFLASWDVWAHDLAPIELHATQGSLRLPDPNFFGGKIGVARRREHFDETIDVAGDPFGAIEWPAAAPEHANWRGLGVAEMGVAIAEGRPHRCDGSIALHVLEVMLGLVESAETGATIVPTTAPPRPAAFGAAEAAALFRSVDAG